jgi:hypothetical protein
MLHSILVSRMMHANKVVDNLRANSYSMILSEAISIPHHKDGDAYPIHRFHTFADVNKDHAQDLESLLPFYYYRNKITLCNVRMQAASFDHKELALVALSF